MISIVPEAVGLNSPLVALSNIDMLNVLHILFAPYAQYY